MAYVLELRACPRFVVATTDKTVDIDLKTITARLRSDPPFGQFVPAHLCATVPEAITVTWPEGSLDCSDS